MPIALLSEAWRHCRRQSSSARSKSAHVIYKKWQGIYRDDFIPLAHGIRLFGMVYNDAVRPSDPFEFMDLLGATAMVSLERNRALEDLASTVRIDASLRDALGRGVIPESFSERFEAFIDEVRRPI